jgi:hypothetical protein
MEVSIENSKSRKAELCIPFQTDMLVQLPAKIKVPPKTCAVLVPVNN